MVFLEMSFLACAPVNTTLLLLAMIHPVNSNHQFSPSFCRIEPLCTLKLLNVCLPTYARSATMQLKISDRRCFLTVHSYVLHPYSTVCCWAYAILAFKVHQPGTPSSITHVCKGHGASIRRQRSALYGFHVDMVTFDMPPLLHLA